MMIIAGHSDGRITAGSQYSCVQLALMSVARSMANVASPILRFWVWEVRCICLLGAVIIYMWNSPLGL